MQYIRLLAITLLTICSLFAGQVRAGGIQDYIHEIPGIGLVADEVDFDGIKLKKLRFHQCQGDDNSFIGDKYVITYPGKKHKVSVKYKLDGDLVDNMELHHFIFGLDKAGPQDCFLHSLGLTDAKGNATFYVTAPAEPGVYALRFCHAVGYGSFEQVKEEWWKTESTNSKSIMGIVVVK